MRSGGSLGPTAAAAARTTVQQHSPWHSPVPYLFGGLAAMLGLIAFALLILACSYWKLSGYLESGDGGDGGERDPESGGDAVKGAQTVYEEKILVIMAGEEKPTFLATPASSRASSFNSEKVQKSEEQQEERAKEGSYDPVESPNGETHESSNQVH